MDSENQDNQDNRHLGLLYDVSELNALLSDKHDIHVFLQKAVELVAQHLRADVCSIYLLDEQTDSLVLEATRGLRPESVGKVRLGHGEGLVGLTLEQDDPVCVARASEHPAFKHIEGIDEELFEAFLSLPIRRGAETIGVIVVQRRKERIFHDTDILALKGTAYQLASAIENARILLALPNPARETELNPLDRLRMVRGQSASEGCVCAEALIIRRRRLHPGKTFATRYSLYDFEKALDKTEEQILTLQKRLDKTLPEMASLIFTAHTMILHDPNFVDRIKEHIQNDINPPTAVLKVAHQYSELFNANPHAYIREKANDVEDLARRIVANLVNKHLDESAGSKGKIIIADQLYPSDILILSTEGVRGVILVSGGVTSHVSILAHSLDIPLVIANEPNLLKIPDATTVVLDADHGNLYVDPDEEIRRRYEEREEARISSRERGEGMHTETCTRDGTRVTLLANVNLLSELSLANDLKAEGIGLYRTEFPFLIRSSPPSEEEQYAVYLKLLDAMRGKEVSIRTLDVGGDKPLAYYDQKLEANPSLGLRSIRFSLRHEDQFRLQLKAILRAGHDFPGLRIMFPMISDVDELRQVKAILAVCMQELADADIPHNEKPAVGIMMELPAAMEIMDDLAEEVDFFCIGSNDFVQYMLAVDRTNEQVANYYQPAHPAVLRGLARIAETGRKRTHDVSICGEIAHQPEFLPFLIGIGIRKLSIDPRFLSDVQETIRNLTVEQAEALAEDVLRASTARSVLEKLRAFRRAN